jgi:hypothetical protein
MTVDGPESPDIVGYQRKFLLTVTTLVSDNRDAEVPPENRGMSLVAPELERLRRGPGSGRLTAGR